MRQAVKRQLISDVELGTYSQGWTRVRSPHLQVKI